MVKPNKLLQDVMMLDFAVNDAALFLDTHPEDKEAFNYYKEALTRLDRAKAEYEKEYGPLNNRTITTDRYNYVYGPWPWEGK